MPFENKKERPVRGVPIQTFSVQFSNLCRKLVNYVNKYFLSHEILVYDLDRAVGTELVISCICDCVAVSDLLVLGKVVLCLTCVLRILRRTCCVQRNQTIIIQTTK